VVGYLWARTAPCSNPTCRGEIPLLRSLLVCNKQDKKVALTMEVDNKRKTVRFGIAEGKAINTTDGTMQNRGNTLCPYCGQVTPVADLRTAGLAGRMGEQMVAVIVEDKGGKGYRPVEDSDLEAFRKASGIPAERPQELILPEVNADDADDDVSNSTGIRVHLYGMKTWGSLFNPRQLVAMQTFVACLHEALEEMKKDIEDDDYRRVVCIYLGLWLSRNAMRMSTVGRWDTGGETFQTPFDRANLPMKWDYPEANPFCGVTGGFLNQLDWIKAFIARESNGAAVPGHVSRGDGAALRLEAGAADATVTDPPYFDEAAYADLSDFFYVWLKRTVGDLAPEALATPLTPKTDEATALKHRHAGDGAAADKHFTDKLAQVFAEAKRVTKPRGLYSIIFAHQETQAWAALIRSLFAAGLTIDATWPIEMEMKNRMRGLNSAALETSITVICRSRVVGSAVAFKDVRREIEQAVRESVKRFWSYGFRGADLIVACYGPAVGVFGKYERVEKADGTPVGIPELLELAKQAARDAIAGEFRGDNLSTLYYVWANLYGTSEQSWDDARLVVQIGGEEDNAMEVARGHGIFVVDGSKCRLALLEDRASRRGLGIDQNPPLIDALHRSMLLWKQEKRKELVGYLGERDLLEDGPFWKLAQALFEVLPRDLEDWKLVSALLGERQTLRTEGKRTAFRDAQAKLDFLEER
jgi:putative DNA methylase